MFYNTFFIDFCPVIAAGARPKGVGGDGQGRVGSGWAGSGGQGRGEWAGSGGQLRAYSEVLCSASDLAELYKNYPSPVCSVRWGV
jgi:hypothetical protein